MKKKKKNSQVTLFEDDISVRNLINLRPVPFILLKLLLLSYMHLTLHREILMQEYFSLL